MTDTFVSPFSYSQHNWAIIWKRIASNEKYDRPFETESAKEKRALEAIASVGIIGGVQLQKFFDIDKARLKRMMGRKMIVRHEIKKNDQSIPIFTIGKAGANKIMPKYIENYWIELNTEAVLKRLIFFQLCTLFDDYEIAPAPSPFVGTIKIKDKDFYAYVTRGNVEDLMMLLKWEDFNERMFIITDNFNYLKPLNAFMQTKKYKIRAISDFHILNNEPTFYKFNINDWCKESI
ncbi:hypothetical protein HRF87_04595 [Bacillus sp. CRN 9]|nr:hypothetical protein [Bacillus sp. CRN 9]